MRTIKDIVSIIVPIYNREHTLMRCVKSIIEQTYKNIQIILIDDGSKDRTLVVAKQIAQSDNRIIVLTQDNSGAALARKTGFQYATGDWIMFVDSDDTIDKNMVQEMINRCHQDDSDICMCGYNIITRDQISHHYLPYNSTALDKDRIVEECIKPMVGYDNRKKVDFLPGFSVNKIFNKKTISESMFFSDREYFAEDTLLQMYAFEKARRVSILNKPLYNYYITSDSLTNGYRKNGGTIRIKTYNKIKDLCNERGYADIQLRLNNHLYGVIVYSVINAVRGSECYHDFKQEFLRIKHTKEFKEFSRLFNLKETPAQYRKIYILLKLPRLMYFYYRKRIGH